MPLPNTNRWTAAQQTLLVQMHGTGRQWPAIVAAVGHPLSSCQQMLSRIRARNGTLTRKHWTDEDLSLVVKLKAQRPKLTDAEIATHFGVTPKAVIETVARLRRNGVDVGNIAAMPEPEEPKRRDKDRIGPVRVTNPDAPFNRTNTSTAKLVLDAELRARIEVLGATGGLLGDPLPGRSALDRRIEGK